MAAAPRGTMGDTAAMVTHPAVAEAELSSLKGKQAPGGAGRDCGGRQPPRLPGPLPRTAWPGSQGGCHEGQRQASLFTSFSLHDFFRQYSGEGVASVSVMLTSDSTRRGGAGAAGRQKPAV